MTTCSTFLIKHKSSVQFFKNILSYVICRDGSGQNSTWDLTQTEAILANFLWTRATQGIILFNLRDQNLTTLWFDMHYSTTLLMIFACTAPPSIDIAIYCQIQSTLTEKLEKNLTRVWPELNFINPSPKATYSRPDLSKISKPETRPKAKKRDPTHP